MRTIRLELHPDMMPDSYVGYDLDGRVTVVGEIGAWARKEPKAERTYRVKAGASAFEVILGEHTSYPPEQNG